MFSVSKYTELWCFSHLRHISLRFPDLLNPVFGLENLRMTPTKTHLTAILGTLLHICFPCHSLLGTLDHPSNAFAMTQVASEKSALSHNHVNRKLCSKMFSWEKVLRPSPLTHCPILPPACSDKHTHHKPHKHTTTQKDVCAVP